MPTSLRNLFLFVLAAATLWAQPDLTVQWKSSLQDLERRVAALPESGPAVAEWRADAESVRASMADFAHPPKSTTTSRR